MNYKIYVTLLFLMCVGLIHGQSLENAPKEVFEIIKANKSKLGSVKQLIVVYNDSVQSYKAVLIALEKKKNKWVITSGPMNTYIGRNGFAAPDAKLEGDGKSPTGLFRLGQLFCYKDSVNTALPHIQTTADDKWIDDPESDDYNKYVRGETSAKTFEKLLIRSDAYKYCMVIEFNTHPVVKGKGSAIFFHLGTEATSGCITILEEQMELILSTLTPKANPSILMGNFEVLRKGL